jgi:exosortase
MHLIENMATTLQDNIVSEKEHGPEKSAADQKWGPAVLPFVVAGLLFLFLVRPLLSWWWWEWTMPESYYAHAPLIPFLTILMLWYRRDALRATPKAPCPTALLVLAPALMLLVVALKEELQAVQSLAFLLTLWSSLWLSLGTRFFRAAAFPVLFLALMAPLPGPVLNDSTLRLQMLSTEFASKILNVLSFPTTLHGNVIRMDNFDLFVDVPCSGFKLLLSLMTFNAAFAYLVDGPPIKRFLLFLFAAPLALVVNAVRVALIGVVGDCISAQAAHVFHDWSGIITLMLGFIALFSLAKVMGCRKFAGWVIF